MLGDVNERVDTYNEFCSFWQEQYEIAMMNEEAQLLELCTHHYLWHRFLLPY